MAWLKFGRRRTRSVGGSSSGRGAPSPAPKPELPWVHPDARSKNTRNADARAPAPSKVAPQPPSMSNSYTEDDVLQDLKGLQVIEKRRPDACFEVHAKVLGNGAYGAVHQGVMHGRTGPQDVAIKVIPESRMRPEVLAREAAVMERLSRTNHPSMVRFYKWCHPGSEEIRAAKKSPELAAQLASSHCLVMEAVVGGELFEYIAAQRGLNEREAGSLLAQLCEAVRVAHDLGIAHRDLKLENVLFSKETGSNRMLKLIDWGLAHQHEIDDNGVPMPEKLHTRCGSKSYMAPEVITCSSSRSHKRNENKHTQGFDAFKADVWSLGICLFAMLFGFFPFEQSDPTKDWRAEKVRDVQLAGGSAVATIIGFYPKKKISISPDAKALLDSMLMFEPTRRGSLHDVLASPYLLKHVAQLRRLSLSEDGLLMPTGADEIDENSAAESSNASSANSEMSNSWMRNRRVSDWTPRPSVALKPLGGRQDTDETDSSLSSVGSSVKRSVARLATLSKPENVMQLSTLPLPPHRPYRQPHHAPSSRG